MPRLQTLTSNFTAGEFSPQLRGRTDIETFNASAEKLENVVVLRQGGATMRPSMDFKGQANGAVSGAKRLIPFVYSRVDAFVLEFGDAYIRFWSNGALVVDALFSPYLLASPYTAAQLPDIQYTQGGDTLLLFHPDVAPRRLRRFGTANWVLDLVPFDPPALYEFGHASATVTLTLSAATVGAGRTATASAATFEAADVGRTITAAGGLMTITAFTSTTVVTGTITQAFQAVLLAATAWRLQGTPFAVLTPSAAGPVGTAITLTLSANGWRAPDGTQGYVEVNGGLVRLTSLTSALIANGTVVRELTGTTAAPADAWVLLGPAWNAFDKYPRTGALLQQRLWLGGSAGFPLSFWGSKSGLFFDFTPGTLDDSAVYKTVDSDDNNIILSLISGWGTLIGLTYAGEFDVRGGIEKPITQLNAQITKRTAWGSSGARPLRTGTDVLFVERGGTAIRALRRDVESGFSAEDVSIFSDHLLLESGIAEMSYEQKPQSVVWCRTGAGKLLAMTYNREQNQVSICSGSTLTNGVVKSIVTVPEGSIDATYALVERTILGTALMYVERLNWAVNPGLDCRSVYSGSPAALIPGFTQLSGQTVAALADDIYVGTFVVTALGQVQLPRDASKLEIGIPYTATVRLSAPEVGTGTGTAQAQAMSTHSISVRFLNTIGCKSNLQDMGFQQFDGPLLDVAPTPFTGVKTVSDSGWENGESVVELVQELPYPFTVLTVVRGLTVNAG